MASGAWSEWKKNGGGSGSGLGEFGYPGGVAVDGNGNVYVADSNNNRIQKLTAATGEWSEWKKSGGGAGSGLGEFNDPSGVEVDGEGECLCGRHGKSSHPEADGSDRGSGASGRRAAAAQAAAWASSMNRTAWR
ncbi:hypothetical protein OMP40_34600 [Cohnella rhizosphaerae]|uniref:NHL repeat containing protein n=1 Tax=Cohnella rhizosphaerae TaxID=1457232 RepID=A0A9X4KZK2_9BACL|nr:hypothetical protein [Cohnella rhizosphaerae]MDG0813842.1 hypothetical protein [Cohnella rhizosphaerae]